ncbi:MAG: glycosyltransferase [Pseudomonadota bacterium]
MHVMIINVFFAPQSYGGATLVAEQVAQHLMADHGVQVSAVSAMSRADLQPYAILKAEVGGVVNRMINLPADRSYPLRYANPDVAERITRIVRQVQPDLVHVHCVQDIGADVLAALHGLGVPTVLSLHDFWWLCERQFMVRLDGTYCAQDPVRIEGCRGCVDDFARAQARQSRLDMLAPMADLITCPGEFARGLYARSGFPSDRLTVWENGVRPPGPDFFAAQKARRERDPRHVFGFVGGPSAIKGWPLLQDTFSSVPRGDFCGLLVDGSLDGSWYAGRDLTRMSGEWSVVPRYGQDEIDGFFSQIDTLLFLSQWKETFGLTIREALVRGVRVIQTDSGGTMEHGAAEHARVVPIGCTPSHLLTEVMGALDGPRGGPPIWVRTYAEQATDFLSLVRPLLGQTIPFARPKSNADMFRSGRDLSVEVAE